MDVGKVSIYEAALKGDFELAKWIVEYSRASLNEFADGHRTALHFSAMSGHFEMFEYLTERCGLDPLQGDENLVTPWDIVRKAIDSAGSEQGIDDLPKDIVGYKKIDKYLEDRYGHSYESFYRNPIRPGFFPDPSICRVGDDYYMVNSSFIFFPCIPISHSRDLIHWEIIGHAITNPEWAGLDELEGGRGYWAPDISYYEGKFYIAATYRLNDTGPVYRRQVVMCSDKPEGPYSKPVFIDEDGIDPSIFNDDDGRRYMLLNRGARIFELDKTGTKKISDAKLLYYGSNKRAPEGPHIYKKDGYYYLIQAEGGTGLGHRVTVARSKSLMGVYEPCPYNPIMRQEDEGAAIQRCGHGDMVETADGRWFMVYLCGRPIKMRLGDDGHETKDAVYTILGRETALDPVTWTPDGWPIINGLKGPSCMQIKPFAKRENKSKTNSPAPNMQLSPCGLPLDYMTPRPFARDAIIYGEDKKGRFFEIKGSEDALSSVDARNILLRRQTSFLNSYSAVLEIPELEEGQSAGITGYYDENTHLLFGLKNKDGKLNIYVKEHIGEENREIEEVLTLTDDNRYVKFTMDNSYFKRKFYYAVLDDVESHTHKNTFFAELKNVYYLCDEGLSKGKRFTGALLGMYCYAGDKNKLSVKFYNYEYKETR
ncbi:MAG: family 43 glycosylhydrolase [Butyrivibrio sp.]|nr:family 43 glycosylhydrolase [Butyrivibrio sp.]